MSRTGPILAALGQLVRDSIHGGTLKAIALLSRLLFFVLVIPVLLAGELTVYIYINSIALIIAIVAIVGMNDELPRIISGDAGKARGYFRSSIVLNIVVMLLLLAMFVWPSVPLGIALFGVATIASRFLGGIVRSVDPAVYERLQNLPWVLFIVSAVVLRLDNAFDLLIARAASTVLVTWYCLFALGRQTPDGAKTAPLPLPALFRRALSHGITKLLSNLSLLGISRAPVLLPVWLAMDADLDPVAFAVAVGEIVVQFGLIPANRAYAAWCRQPPTKLRDWYHAITLSLLLAAALAGLSIVILLIANAVQMLPEQAPGNAMLTQALVLYALVSAFYSLRYLVWARGVLEYRIVLLSLGMLAGCAVAILWVDIRIWFAACAGVAVIGFAALAVSSRRYFTG